MRLADAPSGLRAAVLRKASFPHNRTPSSDLVPGPAEDSLGSAVAVLGNVALVGAPGVNNSAGAVYVFGRHRSRWGLQTVLTDPRDRPGDAFGGHVALAGHTAMVGDDRALTYVYGTSGPRWRITQKIPVAGMLAMTASLAVVDDLPVVRVYARSGSRWRPQATLTAPAGLEHNFGCALAVSGATVVVGDCTNNGAAVALVYQRSATGWHRQASLVDPSSAIDDSFGSAVAVSGATIMVGAGGSRFVDTAVYVYSHSKSGWKLRTKFTAPRAANFGASIALSGATASIGAPGVKNGSGAIDVYTLTGGRWQRQAVLAGPDRSTNSGFGAAMAVSDGTIVTGSTSVGFGSGAGYAYERSGTHWGRQGNMVDPYAVPGADKGAAVAISGPLAVVGAWGADGHRGAAYVYAESRGRWHQQATLTDPARFGIASWFGAAVAISGSTIVVGAWGPFGTVGVYVYVKSGRRWHLQEQIADPNEPYVSGFGAAVAISASTMAIGAPNTGAVYVYRRSGTGWLKQTTLHAIADRAGDSFGEAVALKTGILVVGDSGTGRDAGSGYIYGWTGSRWRLQSRIADPDGRPNDGFGAAVAVSGATAVIGAPGVHDFTGAAYIYGRTKSRWHRTTTITIPRADNVSGGFGSATAMAGTGQGAVILLSGVSVSGLTTARKRCGHVFQFTRLGRHWRELARIDDPECTSYDEFGYALSVSGSTMLIGAPGADSNSGTAWPLAVVKPRNSTYARPSGAGTYQFTFTG
jgi:hypothetical protein